MQYMIFQYGGELVLVQLILIDLEAILEKLLICLCCFHIFFPAFLWQQFWLQ